MRLLAIPFALYLMFSAAGEAQEPSNGANLTIAVEALGDVDQGVVTRLSFRYAIPSDVPPQVPLVIQGSIIQGGSVLRNFRLELTPETGDLLRTIQVLPPGDVQVDARLMIPLEEQSPVIVGKAESTFTIARSGKRYVAAADADAEGVMAEGTLPDSPGAVRIRPPRRDVAPNLFIVDVDVKLPVRKVEFWVEGKKVLTRTAAPYRAELDLGKLPKRVEVRAVGFDERGHYVDADAFVVNERDTQLEVKITRTATPDGISHFKLSVQNPKNTTIRSVALYAGKKKLREWSAPPYAIDVPTASLGDTEYMRASVIDTTNYEASDLLYLGGQRYSEELDVNLVELPVSVTDAAGAPITDLKQSEFAVLESGKPQKIVAFNFASNLPISVGMLLDHSGSMQPRIKEAKQAAIEFFKSILKPADRAFFDAFSFDSKHLAPFTSDVGALETQVNASPEAIGGTALYDAIVTGLYQFRSTQGRKALVIITDGEDTSSRTGYEDMLTYVRSARVPLYFIGVGLRFSDISGTSKMKSLAAETGGVAYFIRDVKQLKQTYSQLEESLRSQYLVSYYTESTKKDETYRPVEVKVERPGARVRTIHGFVP